MLPVRAEAPGPAASARWRSSLRRAAEVVQSGACARHPPGELAVAPGGFGRVGVHARAVGDAPAVLNEAGEHAELDLGVGQLVTLRRTVVGLDLLAGGVDAPSRVREIAVRGRCGKRWTSWRRAARRKRRSEGSPMSDAERDDRGVAESPPRVFQSLPEQVGGAVSPIPGRRVLEGASE